MIVVAMSFLAWSAEPARFGFGHALEADRTCGLGAEQVAARLPSEARDAFRFWVDYPSAAVFENKPACAKHHTEDGQWMFSPDRPQDRPVVRAGAASAGPETLVLWTAKDALPPRDTRLLHIETLGAKQVRWLEGSGSLQALSLRLTGDAPRMPDLSRHTKLDTLYVSVEADVSVAELSALVKQTGVRTLGIRLLGPTAVDWQLLGSLPVLDSLYIRGAQGIETLDLSALAQTDALTSVTLTHFPSVDALDLSGLARHRGLSKLAIWSFQRMTALDLAPVAGLPLTDVRINVHRLRALNLAPLAASGELRTLVAEWLKIGRLDLAPLARNPELTRLVLDHMPVTELDLSPLASLTKLKTLWIRSFENLGRLDLAPLRGHAALVELDLKNLPIGSLDLGPVSSLVGLEILDLRGRSLPARVDLSPLKGLPGLRELYLSELETSLGPIAEARALEVLELATVYLGQTALTPVARMPNLRVLRLDTPRDPVDLGALAGHPSLRRVSLSFVHLDPSAIGSLATMPRLEQLQLDSPRVTGTLDLTPLGDAPRLTTLDVEDTVTVTGLRLPASPSLEVVRLRLTEGDVAALDLTPLTRSPGLRVLSLSQSFEATPIDLAPLASHRRLESFVLLGWERLPHRPAASRCSGSPRCATSGSARCTPRSPLRQGARGGRRAGARRCPVSCPVSRARVSFRRHARAPAARLLRAPGGRFVGAKRPVSRGDVTRRRRSVVPPAPVTARAPSPPLRARRGSLGGSSP